MSARRPWRRSSRRCAARPWPVSGCCSWTIDPERDTPAALEPYLRAFGGGLVGLYGSVAARAPLERSLGALAERREGPAGSYRFEHSATLYLLDAQGRMAAVFTRRSARPPWGPTCRRWRRPQSCEHPGERRGADRGAPVRLPAASAPPAPALAPDRSARPGSLAAPALIALFLRSYRPELRDALEPDPGRYSSFNAFFTRALREGARPLADPQSAIVSPVDGTISALGRISAGRLLQAKGHDYSLAALLAGEEALAGQLARGRVHDHLSGALQLHRIHMALAGRLCAARYVPGGCSASMTRRRAWSRTCFARNERVVLSFEGACGRYALVMVGALFVGSMSTVWHGRYRTARRPIPTRPGAARSGPASQLPRGAELGRFNMDQTVILPCCRRRRGAGRPACPRAARCAFGERIGALPGAGPP